MGQIKVKSQTTITFLIWVYALICIMDFIVIPTFLGLRRAVLITSLEETSALLNGFDLEIQRQLIAAATAQHTPLTLQFGGIFHAAFGGIISGVTWRKT